MSRPKKCRCINCTPNTSYFKPRGIPLLHLEEISLGLDELEAIRLADYEGHYHEEAARKMNISRATFGRILDEARHKVSDAIVNGKALRIDSHGLARGNLSSLHSEREGEAPQALLGEGATQAPVIEIKYNDNGRLNNEGMLCSTKR